MTFFQSIVYGLVQGFTEFLPISSSAHLILLPWFFGWEDPGLAFDVALHWGTLFGVITYFWKDLLTIGKGFLGSLQGKREFENKLPWFLIVGTVPGAALGYVFENQAETIFRSPLLIAGTLSILGILLYIADRKSKTGRGFGELNWKLALLVGISQGFAIIPGVSRSGITITSGAFFGLNRESAVRFSFLLSIPIIAGAGILKISYLLSNLTNPNILIGIFTAALAGYGAIYFLMHHVKTKSFLPFVVYRFGLSLLILLKLFIY